MSIENRSIMIVLCLRRVDFFSGVQFAISCYRVAWVDFWRSCCCVFFLINWLFYGELSNNWGFVMLIREEWRIRSSSVALLVNGHWLKLSICKIFTTNFQWQCKQLNGCIMSDGSWIGFFASFYWAGVTDKVNDGGSMQV